MSLAGVDRSTAIPVWSWRLGTLWGINTRVVGSDRGADQDEPMQGEKMTQINDEERKKALVLRLKRIEGQLRGIQRLIEEGAECEKVAQQLAAARKALDKSFFTLVGCVIAQGDVPADDVADLLTRFS